jgi:hypothetical protein
MPAQFGEHERLIRAWCARTSVGRGRRVGGREQYRDIPALVAIAGGCGDVAVLFCWLPITRDAHAWLDHRR